MRCIKCGAVLTDPGYCSSCGTEIKIYERLIRLSNTYYNMGLEKAKARNLSGAMSDLRYSLELNKNHIQARNLLGLICFEVGDVVSALTEWIISKNLEPEKNIADEYINAIQANPARLETINQTIKKYNQSLLYCQQGSEDLAIIQLKKVLSLNPKLVKAHQLLALLYIRTEEYERAGRELRRALAIDRTDNLSLRYQAELEELTGKPAGRDRKPEKEKETKKPDIISYTSGNETIIMPAGYKENTGVNVILNIFIGLVVGVALMWFLAVPAKVQSVRGQTAEQIREYSDQLAARQAEVNELQSQLYLSGVTDLSLESALSLQQEKEGLKLQEELLELEKKNVGNSCLTMPEAFTIRFTEMYTPMRSRRSSTPERRPMTRRITRRPPQACSGSWILTSVTATATPCTIWPVPMRIWDRTRRLWISSRGSRKAIPAPSGRPTRTAPSPGCSLWWIRPREKSKAARRMRRIRRSRTARTARRHSKSGRSST